MNQLKLRAHHGMCLHFYQGQGYGDDFTLQMNRIKISLLENPSITIIKDADTICTACPHLMNGSCESAAQTADYDAKVLQYCGLEPGIEIRWNDFEAIVRSRILLTNRRSKICGDCQWNYLCQ